jgi:methionyl-tRNA formyltransferase
MKALRIVFMGTPDFSVAALDALFTAGHEIVAVYTQPPRPKGRGHQVQISPVQAFAEKNGLPVFHPKSLKSADEQKKLSDLKADVAVVAAYGLILPKAVLGAPKHGCINIHASLLPRWRGASPIQRAILAGDSETGVTLMQMDAGLDTGAMIVKRSMKIEPYTTAQSLHDDLSVMGAAMILDVMNRLAGGEKLTAETQDESKTTYAPLLTKDDGKVDWNKSAAEIDRQVRALNPWPGVWTTFKGKRIKILEAKMTDDKSGSAAGEITDRTGKVACGKSTTLQLLTIQPENAKAMDFAAAVNGGYIGVNERFL